MFAINEHIVYYLIMSDELKLVIEFFGSKSELQKQLNVSAMVVYQWSKRKIPAERAHEIERISEGKVKVSDLRPDLFANKHLEHGSMSSQ